MDPSLEIEEAKQANFNRQLTNELEYLNSSKNTNIFTNIQEQDINNRKVILQSLLNIPIKKIDTAQQQKDNMFKELDKYIYKKQWTKLTAFHKIVKIKEYINETVSDNSMKDEIITQLCKCAEQNSINPKKYVIYDPNAEKILSMPCLIIDEEKNTYQIKCVQ